MDDAFFSLLSFSLRCSLTPRYKDEGSVPESIPNGIAAGGVIRGSGVRAAEVVFT